MNIKKFEIQRRKITAGVLKFFLKKVSEDFLKKGTTPLEFHFDVVSFSHPRWLAKAYWLQKFPKQKASFSILTQVLCQVLMVAGGKHEMLPRSE
jgi:hypothetical protein